VALAATIRAAAVHQSARGRSGPALVIRPVDVHDKVRVRPPSRLVLFMLDVSWSMSAARRVAAAQGAVVRLLTHAYQRRDHVGLIVFQGAAARLLLPPTRSVGLAQRRLSSIAVGGKTPLAAAFVRAREVFARARRPRHDVKLHLVVLTDGAANVPLAGGDPFDDAVRLARAVRRMGVESLVIEAGPARSRRRWAAELASHLGGACVQLADLSPGRVQAVVMRSLGRDGRAGAA
jgi:magnesium chelatase subunit D